ncbi:MotA/TolQ/ExbB proton channel family protein [Fibrobacter sp.]|uniref:MotA/TolQ/ExbB proton channel family protein n=1 Tax=Fibrobacter sp. TaxID=35828 RepID=UPI0038904ED8
MNNNWYIFIESVRNTYEAGGVVMLPILLAGVIGFYYLYSSWFRIGSDFFRKDVGKSVEIMRRELTNGNGSDESIRKSISLLEKRRGLLSRELRRALNVALERRSELRDYAQVRMIKTVQYMEQGSHIVAVMAAAAPLLGLLGTVTGMVSTFDVITLYGNQNPVLMADGISEALISTQSGLLVAFPLTLLKQRLDERIELLKQQLELGATILENSVTSSPTMANMSSPT